MIGTLVILAAFGLMTACCADQVRPFESPASVRLPVDGPEVEAADYGFSPVAAPADNVRALQRALDGGYRTVRVTKPGIYRLDATVYLDDATHLIFGPGVELHKAARYSNVLVNRGAYTGVTNVDIRVDGVSIHVDGNDEMPPLDSKAAGVRAQLAFYHVRRLQVTDLKILDFKYCQYAFQVADFEDFLLDGFDVRGDRDGIHINCGRRFVVRNGICRTLDDGIALNATDWPTSAPCVGPIEDGVIENIVDLPGGSCNFARVLTGSTPEWHRGIVLQRGDTVRHGRNVYFVNMPVGTNTYVSTVAPTHGQGEWTSPDGIVFLYAQSDGCRTSSIRNVRFRNITLKGNRGILCTWDGTEWARSMHPDVPVEDMPVTEFSIDGLTSAGGSLVRGRGHLDLRLSNIRYPADQLMIAMHPYGDRKLRCRVAVTNLTLTGGGSSPTFEFDGPNTEAEVEARGVVGGAGLSVLSTRNAKVTYRGKSRPNRIFEPKISVFAKFIRQTAKERGISLSAAADLLYDLGVRGYDCGPDEEDLDELAATKLKAINFYYFPDWFGTDVHDWALDYTDRTNPTECIAKAKRYGIPRIMVVPPNFTDGKENEAEFAVIVGKMRAFVAEAKAAGLVVTVETFGGTKNCCSHVKFLKRLLAEIPDLKFALDSGNLYYAGRGEDILEMMEYAKGRIAHVHLKDQTAEDGRKFVTLGLGVVPNEKIVKAMAAVRYDGWYTLENTVPGADTYTEVVRQVAVLKSWLTATGDKHQ